MKAEDIKDFLEFRKKFTKREWFEINKAVSDQENKRADQIILDDSDVKKVMARIVSNKLLDLTNDDRMSIIENLANDFNVWD